MDRSMGYDLDGVMGTRNDGQLVSQQAPRAVVTRAPGLVEEGDQSGGGFNSNKMITRGTKRVANLGAFAVEVPFIGKLEWKNIALGAAVLYIAQKTILSKRGKSKTAAAFAAGLKA